MEEERRFSVIWSFLRLLLILSIFSSCRPGTWVTKEQGTTAQLLYSVRVLECIYFYYYTRLDIFPQRSLYRYFLQTLLYITVDTKMSFFLILPVVAPYERGTVVQHQANTEWKQRNIENMKEAGRGLGSNSPIQPSIYIQQSSSSMVFNGSKQHKLSILFIFPIIVNKHIDPVELYLLFKTIFLPLYISWVCIDNSLNPF